METAQRRNDRLTSHPVVITMQIIYVMLKHSVRRFYTHTELYCQSIVNPTKVAVWRGW